MQVILGKDLDVCSIVSLSEPTIFNPQLIIFLGYLSPYHFVRYEITYFMSFQMQTDQNSFNVTIT